MASEMTGKFREEQAAIQQLRRIFSDEKQMTLAKRIRTVNFSDEKNQVLARKTSHRSVLSIYSVIRRYDHDQKQAALAKSDNSVGNIPANAIVV